MYLGGGLCGVLLQPLHKHGLLASARLAVEHQRLVEFGLGMLGQPLLDAKGIPRGAIEDSLGAVVLDGHGAGTALLGGLLDVVGVALVVQLLVFVVFNGGRRRNFGTSHAWKCYNVRCQSNIKNDPIMACRGPKREDCSRL